MARRIAELEDERQQQEQRISELEDELRNRRGEAEDQLVVAQQTIAEQQNQLAEMADHIIAGRKSDDYAHDASMCALIGALLIISRYLIYFLVEMFAFHGESMVIDWLFDIAGFVIACTWVGLGWQALRWMIVPKIIVVAVALSFAGFMVNDLSNDPAVRFNPFVMACPVLVAVPVVILAASPWIERGLIAMRTHLLGGEW